jgi:hypothetical protein
MHKEIKFPTSVEDTTYETKKIYEETFNISEMDDIFSGCGLVAGGY